MTVCHGRQFVGIDLDEVGFGFGVDVGRDVDVARGRGVLWVGEVALRTGETKESQNTLKARQAIQKKIMPTMIEVVFAFFFL